MLKYKENRFFLLFIPLFLAVLIATTDLFYSAGFLICGIAFLFCVTDKRFNVGSENEQFCIAVLFISTVVTVIWREIFKNSSNVNMVIASVVSVLMFYSLSQRNDTTVGNHLINFFERCIFLLFYIMAGKEIIIAIQEHGLMEAPRSHLYMDVFHYGDWSVVMILLFMLGIKVRAYALTVPMSVITWIVLPARMYKLFVIAFCIILIFQIIFHMNGIIDGLKMFKIRYFKIIIWILILSCLFSFFWVGIVIANNSVQATHQGINDQANAQRFWYSVVTVEGIITRYIPFLEGKLAYSDINLVSAYPHNSFLEMIWEYGFIFSIAYWKIISRFFERNSSRINDSLILSYLLCAALLHNMLEGWRVFALLSIIMLPAFSRIQRKNTLSGRTENYHCKNEIMNTNVSMES